MRNSATDRSAVKKNMAIHKKHPRGSSGLQELENGPDESGTLPNLHRRVPSEVSPPRESDPDEERWRDDGGESGEVV